mgnify:CR=1 FL=1
MPFLASKKQKKPKKSSKVNPVINNNSNNNDFFPRRTGNKEINYLRRKIKEGKEAEVNETVKKAYNKVNTYIKVANRIGIPDVLKPVPKFNSKTLAGRRSAKKGITKPKLKIQTMFNIPSNKNNKSNKTSKNNKTFKNNKKSKIRMTTL